MKSKHFIEDRIRTANAKSPIAVELFYKNGEKELRSYFAAPLPAPKKWIAPFTDLENPTHVFHTEVPIYGTQNTHARESRKYIPLRVPDNQLGQFFGESGVAEFKKLAFAHGF